MNIVEQIHREFYTASEKILSKVCTEKAKTLHELGFTSSKDAASYDPVNEELKRLVLEYQYLCPNQKFITDSEVERICTKYNLVCGPVSCYTGSVPTDKLEQIASFNGVPHRLDRPKKYRYHLKYHDMGFSGSAFFHKGDPMYKKLPKHIDSDRGLGAFGLNSMIIEKFNLKYSYVVDSAIEEDITVKGMMICAPPDEMNLKGTSRVGIFSMFTTKRKIEDPVVLQPVKGGFLILAAWGPEASDIDVVNHKMN